MDHILIGQIAGVMALVQIIPYVISILRGHTKPERMSYFIWLLVSIIGVASYICVGARTTIWTGIVFTLTGLLVFILSIKHGIGGFSSFDIICFLMALSGALIWFITKNALVALYFTTFVGFIGYLPTIKKVYFLPKTENTLSWSLAAAASILNLLALTNLQPRIVIPVAASALLQASVSYLLIFPNARFRSTPKRPHRIHAFLAHPIFAR